MPQHTKRSIKMSLKKAIIALNSYITYFAIILAVIVILSVLDYADPAFGNFYYVYVTPSGLVTLLTYIEYTAIALIFISFISEIVEVSSISKKTKTITLSPVVIFVFLALSLAITIPLDTAVLNMNTVGGIIEAFDSSLVIAATLIPVAIQLIGGWKLLTKNLFYGAISILSFLSFSFVFPITSLVNLMISNLTGAVGFLQLGIISILMFFAFLISTVYRKSFFT